MGNYVQGRMTWCLYKNHRISTRETDICYFKAHMNVKSHWRLVNISSTTYVSKMPNAGLIASINLEKLVYG